MATYPVVTIVNIDKEKISDEMNMNKCNVTFKFDKDITDYVVRVGGISYDSGIIAQKIESPEGIATDQLVGYWNSKQGISGTTWSNIAPLSPVMNGTIFGATVTPDGMYLDGVDDDISFSINADQYTYFSDTYSPWSFELWLRVDNYQITPDILIQSNTSQTNLFVYSANQIRVQISRLNGTIAMQKNLPFNYTTGLAQITIVNDPINKFIKVYVNGALVHTEDGVFGSLLQTNKFLIGTLEKGKYSPKGIFDGIKMYRKVLSATEISKNFQNKLNVGLATIIPANTEIVAEIDNMELGQEGVNRVNIYGKGKDGQWTPYDS